MREPAASASGADQSLQVRSGVAELPLRVRNSTEHPVGVAARQVRLPQRATAPASCTGASNSPAAPGDSPSRKTRPMSLVAASTVFPEDSSRVVSPSPVSVIRVTPRSGAKP